MMSLTISVPDQVYSKIWYEMMDEARFGGSAMIHEFVATKYKAVFSEDIYSLTFDTIDDKLAFVMRFG